MKAKLFKKIIFLLLQVPMLTLYTYAQTENKIVSITDPIDPGKALVYSGTYIYQGTRSSGGTGPVKVRPYYKNGTYYLYADYYLGSADFPNGFAWYITDNILTVDPSSWVYWGWDGTSGMDYPEECTWWGDYSGHDVTITVTNAASGVAPSVTTMEASLVTTTSGTMGGNITADGGATTTRGFVYSSTDNTPIIGEPQVIQITKGTGTGTYIEVVSSLTAGVTYYYRAYGINSYGTTYGTVKSFTTPITSAPNKIVSSAGGANGIYVWIGQYYGKPAWKHVSLNYWLYYSRYGIAFPSQYYWYIDDELKDEHGYEDFNYDHVDVATCPSSGWRNPDNSGTSVSIADYPQIDFTNGSAYNPGNATGGTNNNPIGCFYLDADITGASLLAVTISAAGNRTGTNTLKLWSSTDATFNSVTDVQLNSQPDGATVTFLDFSSSVSASGTYYFITTDLATAATGTYSLTIESKANLIFSGGASSTVFSNASLTSSTISIIPVVEINVKGNDITINDGDGSPSLSDYTDFGNTDIAGGTVVRTFTIENLGAGTLSLTDVANSFISITGADFSLTKTPSSSITNGVPTTFQVTFNPTTTGLKTGTISIANNDTDENPYNFSIQGTGTNLAPTDISLSTNSVNENVADNTVVGVLSTTDANAGDTHTYTLVEGIDDTDNTSFNISGSSLRITNSPDFETKNSYSIRIRTTDQGDLTYEEAFTVTIINVDEAPTVSTQEVSSISTTTATGNGTITSLGDPLPIAYGICWNTTGTPTTSDSMVDNGAASSTGVFTVSMTSLSANTTYYVRAYATNTAGTGYGSEVSFTTNAISVPTISFNTTNSSGSESLSSANLQVDLSTASESTVTVDYSVTGTATGSGTDYTLANGTLTITVGNTSNNITITNIVDDVLVEGDETVVVTLSNPVNATLGTNVEHTYTINDNDFTTNISDISKSCVSVYPIPFTNNIYFNNLNSNISYIIVNDLSGQTVFSTYYEGKGNISLGHLASGVYLLKIVSKNGDKQVIKIVKK